MTKQEKYEVRQAGALALDILSQRLHLPLDNGKVNRNKIEDNIVIGLYSGNLQPISENIVELAIASVQDMVDMQAKTLRDNDET
jgi:hypothetical protein